MKYEIMANFHQHPTPIKKMNNKILVAISILEITVALSLVSCNDAKEVYNPQYTQVYDSQYTPTGTPFYVNIVVGQRVTMKERSLSPVYIYFEKENIIKIETPGCTPIYIDINKKETHKISFPKYPIMYVSINKEGLLIIQQPPLPDVIVNLKGGNSINQITKKSFSTASPTVFSFED